MKLFRFFVAIVLSLFALAHPVQAADETPWYDIELILFKQGTSSSETTENWPEDPGNPNWTETVNLLPHPSDDEALQPYALLPRTTWRLSAQFNALQRTHDGTEPLFHQAWRQPVTASRAAQNIYLGPDLIRKNGAPPPPFEGLIKISVNRYLHVELDILLRGANNGLPFSTPDAVLSPNRGSIRFHANRRMRSGELHYIDHPRMGALILISRVELPEPESLPPSEPATPDSETPTPEAPPQVPEETPPSPATN